jgi:hypothetical protein
MYVRQLLKGATLRVAEWANHHHGCHGAQRLGGHQDVVFRDQPGNDERIATGLEA